MHGPTVLAGGPGAYVGAGKMSAGQRTMLRASCSISSAVETMRVPAA